MILHVARLASKKKIKNPDLDLASNVRTFCSIANAQMMIKINSKRRISKSKYDSKLAFEKNLKQDRTYDLLVTVTVNIARSNKI